MCNKKHFRPNSVPVIHAFDYPYRTRGGDRECRIVGYVIHKRYPVLVAYYNETLKQECIQHYTEDLKAYHPDDDAYNGDEHESDLILKHYTDSWKIDDPIIVANGPHTGIKRRHFLNYNPIYNKINTFPEGRTSYSDEYEDAPYESWENAWTYEAYKEMMRNIYKLNEK